MPIGHDFDDLLWDRVYVGPFSTFSAYGTPTYTSSSDWLNYTCLVEHTRHKVTGPDGEDVVANSYVYIGPTTSGGLPPQLSPKDKLVLSASWGTTGDLSANPRLITADRYADESSGRYAAVAHCA